LGGTGPVPALIGRRRSLGSTAYEGPDGPAARSGLDGVGGGREAPRSPHRIRTENDPLVPGRSRTCRTGPRSGAQDDGFAVEGHVEDPTEASREPSSLPPLSASLRWNRSGSSLSSQDRGPSVAARVRRTARATAGRFRAERPMPVGNFEWRACVHESQLPRLPEGPEDSRSPGLRVLSTTTFIGPASSGECRTPWDVVEAGPTKLLSRVFASAVSRALATQTGRRSAGTARPLSDVRQARLVPWIVVTS
jgi:hypothetical protein